MAYTNTFPQNNNSSGTVGASIPIPIPKEEFIPFFPNKVSPIYFNSLENITNFIKEYKNSTDNKNKCAFLRNNIINEFDYIKNEINRYFALLMPSK